MGREARLRCERPKAKILTEMGIGHAPATEGAQLVSEIDKLPTVMVQRDDAENLKWPREGGSVSRPVPSLHMSKTRTACDPFVVAD